MKVKKDAQGEKKIVPGKSEPLICCCGKMGSNGPILSGKEDAEDVPQRQNGVDYFLYLVYTKIE